MRPQKLSTAHTSAGNLPDWQIERATRLHRVFIAVAIASSSRSLTRRLAKAARRLNDKPFRCDAGRRWRASSKSMERWWYQWKHGGRTRDAVQLRYRSSTAPRVTPELLQAFIRICGEPHTRTCLGAFRQLKREWPAPLPVTYSTLCRYLGRKTLNQLRAYHKAVAESQAALASAKAKTETEILLRLPQQPRKAAA